MGALNAGLCVELFFRWLHVMTAIVWVGQTYFFYLAFMHAFPFFDKDTIERVNPPLLGRVLWWFKWSALLTLVGGLFLYVRIYMWTGTTFGPNGLLLDPDGSLSGRSYWIHMGMVLGIIMVALTWFGIVPTQNRVLARTAEGGAPPSPAEMRRIMLGKPIMYLSGPAVFGMLGASHFSSLNIMWFISILAALGVVHLTYLAAFRVKGFEKKSPPNP